MSQESSDTSMAGPAGFRARSDSLDIFTMSPLGSPFSSAHEDTHMRLPEPPVFDLDHSPPSTPNSPTSFSFSPRLRAHVGTSYGTDVTSLGGSWSPRVDAHDDETGNDDDDKPVAARADKGKAVQREPLAELGTALESALGRGKGKARAEEPTLPFHSDAEAEVIDLSEPPVVRLSPGGHYRQFGDDVGTSPTPPNVDTVPPSPGLPPRIPTHRRSFSSLSIRSIRSSSSRSMASIRSTADGLRGRVKSMAPAAQKLKGSLRKVFRRKGPQADDDADSTDDEEEQRHIFEEPSPANVAADALFHTHGHAQEPSAETVTAIVKTAVQERPLKHRSISAPLPTSEPEPEPGPPRTEDQSMEVTTHAEPDTAQEVLPNHFNDLLPRELQLAVLRTLLALHEVDHTCATKTWTARTAARSRWVGRDKGVRELVKFTRVSKAWQALAFDGQLWRTLHLSSFPPSHLAPALLLRLAAHAGPFVRSLELRGWSHLDPVTLRALVRSLSPAPPDSAVSPFPPTNLTHLALRTCTALTAHALHHVLLRAPALRSVDLRGLAVVGVPTCGVLAAYCPWLESVDLRRCAGVDGAALIELVGEGTGRGWDGVGVGKGERRLKVLRAAGARRVDADVMRALARGAPRLEVLDLGGARDLTDGAVGAFVAWDSACAANTKLELSARELGRDPAADGGPFLRRCTALRHVVLSACPLLTDKACTHLAFCVPRLELLELAGIGPALGDEGLVRLLRTTPRLRRLDLEDACDITDAVLDALTPTSAIPTPPLEHLTLSYAHSLTAPALLALVHANPCLTTLEADNTRISGAVVREFVRVMRARGTHGAGLVAVDCRAVTESLVRELAAAGETRARRGWRAWEARGLGYVDGREGTVGGIDECDETRVVLKSFWSWQGVDAVRRERERERARRRRRAAEAGWGDAAWRRARAQGDEEGQNEEDEDEGDEGMFGEDGAGPSSARRPRWLGHWTRASSRSGSGSSSPALGNDDERGCTIM